MHTVSEIDQQFVAGGATEAFWMPQGLKGGKRLKIRRNIEKYR